MIVVAIIGILAAVAIPAFQKYIKKSKNSEVFLNLRKIYDGEVTYWQEEHTDIDGNVIDKQFVYCPATPSMTPGLNKQIGNWDQPSWSAIKFASDSAVQYEYGVELDHPDAARPSPNFAAWAVGDIDDDGETSLFYRVGWVEDGNVLGAGGIYSVDETE